MPGPKPQGDHALTVRERSAIYRAAKREQAARLLAVLNDIEAARTAAEARKLATLAKEILNNQKA